MGIPYYILTHKETGRTLRRATCEHCGTPFRYTVEITTKGEAWFDVLHIRKARAARMAREIAERRLRQALKYAPFPVPCPACGCYQDDMVAAVRYHQYKRMRWLVVGLACAAPVLFCVAFGGVVFVIAPLLPALGQDAFLSLVMVGSFVVAAGPAYAAYIRRRLKQAAFDPNRDIPEEERFTIARNWASVDSPDVGHPI